MTGPDQPDRSVTLAREWAEVVTATAYVPKSPDDLDEYLLDLVHRLNGSLNTQPFSTAVGIEVGGMMVIGQLVGIDTLQRSVGLLADKLDAPPDRLLKLLAAVCSGYADALRRRTLDQQEDMKRALLSAKQRAERVMQATENRFREVFAHSPVGLAITDADGVFIETNPALAEILACPQEELAGNALASYFTEDDSGADGLRGRRKLVRGDGDTAWVYVAMTLLSDGEREQYVATVQDLSELQLLQGRFGHQLLHDALTGVANRLYFESALETRLGRAAPDASITLCCLNLDGFSMLNEGLGHEVGDQLLRTVAKRLEGVMAEEKALVARIGGAEFAILVEDGQGTPDIPQLVARINDALAEPEYINGRGVAVGATVGAIRSPAGRMSGAELFRAADAALHSARAAGRRQWTRYDPVQDERLRQAYRDAAALPGAFESGELTLSYQPVVRLKDRATVGLRAGLCWSGRAGGPLGDNETMELAERAGHSVLLGPWTLEQACQNLALCQLHADGEPDSVLRIRLTRFQSADDDLVAAVLKATEAGGVEPHQLQLGFDTGAVLEEFGSSADNLEVVSDIGMHTALWRFNGGPRELAMLEGSSARSVILADPFGDREHAEGSYVRRATASLVCQLKELDVEVSVDGVGSESDAEWWAGIGLDTATGQLFGEPVAPEKLLTGNGPVASG